MTLEHHVDERLRLVNWEQKIRGQDLIAVEDTAIIASMEKGEIILGRLTDQSLPAKIASLWGGLRGLGDLNRPRARGHRSAVVRS